MDVSSVNSPNRVRLITVIMTNYTNYSTLRLFRDREIPDHEPHRSCMREIQVPVGEGINKYMFIHGIFLLQVDKAKLL